jgi:hypothetical protein
VTDCIFLKERKRDGLIHYISMRFDLATSAVVWNDCLYVFGGYDGAERLSSFEKFDFVVYDLSFEVPPSTIIHDLRSLVNNEMLSGEKSSMFCLFSPI